MIKLYHFNYKVSDFLLIPILMLHDFIDKNMSSKIKIKSSFN